MKKTILAFALALCTVGAFAQQAPAAKKSAKTAKHVVKAAKKDGVKAVTPAKAVKTVKAAKVVKTTAPKAKKG